MLPINIQQGEGPHDEVSQQVQTLEMADFN